MPTHLPTSDSESNKRQRTDSSVAGASDAIPASVAVASVATPVANHGHFLKANIVGVLCTKCGCPVQIRGSKLWIPNRKVIKRHWKNNPQCYVGNQFPNASNTESQLKADQIAMHERISRQPSAAQSLLSDAFPTEHCDKKKKKCCTKCGFTSSEACDFKTHYGRKNQYGCLRELHSTQGKETVVTNKNTGVTLPQTLIEQINTGKFSLPYRSNTQYTPRSNTQYTQMPPPSLPVTQLPPPSTVTPQRQCIPQVTFHASQNEMAKATLPQARPVAVNARETVNEALQCFINASKTPAEQKQQLDYAKMHETTLLPLIDHASNPRDFSTKLREMSRQQDQPFNSSEDYPMLRVILLAGELWLNSQSANLDVNRIMAKHRSMLYQIGSHVELPNEEKLLDGRTFVPTGKMHHIVKEYEHLIRFIFRRGFVGMDTHIDHVTRIYDSIYLEENEEDKRVQIAAKLLVDTTVIPGILCSVLLEKPSTANGINTISSHITARSVKVVNNRAFIEFKSGNIIAKIANSILRLFRHAMCSLLCRKAGEMKASNQTHQEFEDFADAILAESQSCVSINTICTRIRSARHINSLRLAKIFKGFDPVTGQVMVEQTYIEKDVWSQSISTLTELFNTHLRPLFNCQDLLTNVLDPSNKLVLVGKENSHIIIDATTESPERTIDIQTEVLPHLDTSSIESTQQHINMCFKCAMCTLLYFSLGAGRGIEVSRIGLYQDFFENFQEYFNRLRFGMRSRKNNNHGVDKNLPVEHLVPPTLSRYIVVCYLCLFEEVDNSDLFHLPSMEKDAADFADACFRKVMNFDVDKPANNFSKKKNRELIVCIHNLIAPKSLAKTSTTDNVAGLFQHSPVVHDESYSSVMYERDRNGKMMPTSLLTATIIHRALGEPTTYSHNSVLSRVVDKVDLQMFDAAIRRALAKPTIQCRPNQQEACRLIDDKTYKGHLILRTAMGSGKSAVGDVPILARKMKGVDIQRTLIVPPHNSLLAQFVDNSNRSFRGTNISVWALDDSATLEEELTSMVDNWDLLYMSIHSLNKMLEDHRHVLESWQIKVVIIDECHLLFGETFRHQHSWKALHRLVALKAKMVFMSGTMNQSMIKMLAHYTGMETNYTVIGNVTTYPPPNVSINIHRAQNPINELTDNVARRIIDDKLVVNIVTNSKDAAVTVSDNLNARQELIEKDYKSAWLTSDCTLGERRGIMENWNQGKIYQSLSSTFNCGTDNSETRGMDYEGIPRGAAVALQAIGRIRPHQQRGQTTKANFWIDINNQYTNDDEWQAEVSYMQACHFFECFRSEDDKLKAIEQLTTLFHPSGFKRIMDGNQCIRKALLATIDVDSNDCDMCSWCTSNNPLLAGADEALEYINQQNEDKRYVLENLPQLLDRCAACNNERGVCYGNECLVNYQERCIKCHGEFQTTLREHQRICKATSITLYGKSTCIYCFLHQDAKGELPNDFPTTECGNEQSRLKCPLGDRVRRILLYDIQNNHLNDDGSMAQVRLKTTGRSSELWYQTMAKNMRQMTEDRNERQRRMDALNQSM